MRNQLRARARIVTVAAILCAVCLPRFGKADTLEEAKEKTEQAKDYINRGDYAAALDALRRLFDLKPTPLVIFNIAMCEKALSRHIEAITSFARYFEMEREWREVNPRLHQLALAALEELYQLVGRLEIIDAPDSASVSIDNVSMGMIPRKTPFYLLPGKHSVRVFKEGLEPLSINVVIGAGAEVKVRANLEEALSRIQVECSDEDAEVRIDGEGVGGCPFDGEIPPGKYRVEVAAPLKKTFRHEVAAEVGKTTVLAVTLSEPKRRPQRTPAFTRADVSPKPKLELAMGIALTSLALGTISIGISAYGTRSYKEYRASLDDTNALASEAGQTIDGSQWTPADYDELGARYDEESKSYTDRRDRARGYRAGSIAGYIVGGALIALGAGLATYYIVQKRKHRTEEKGRPGYELSLYHSGLVLQF